jgi:hypothetical protein
MSKNRGGSSGHGKEKKEWREVIETMCDIEKAYEYSISYLDSGNGMNLDEIFAEKKRGDMRQCV